MRPLTLSATLLFCVGCVAQVPEHHQVPQELVRSRSDSAAVIASAWETAIAGHRGSRAAVLWIPAASDTVSFIPLSAQARVALGQVGVPLAARGVAGDDTVVFRLTGFQADSAEVVVELHSAWTTVYRGGARPCRSGAGNVERFRVRSVDRTWRAARHGYVLHGDSGCMPIPPA